MVLPRFICFELFEWAWANFFFPETTFIILQVMTTKRYKYCYKVKLLVLHVGLISIFEFFTFSSLDYANRQSADSFSFLTIVPFGASRLPWQDPATSASARFFTILVVLESFLP